MVSVNTTTMILLYAFEFLAYGAVLLQLYRWDRRRLLEARCTLHRWTAIGHGGMVCALCHKRVAQSLIGFPKINIFDRDWPLF